MLRLIALALFAALFNLAPTVVVAQTDPRFEEVQTRNGPFGLMGPREPLGYGRLTTNDLFGDGEDRWRTGSLLASRVWGPEWDGQLPNQFGSLIELRFFSQILAPDNLTSVRRNDRAWAGAISLGLHTHFMLGQAEMSVGGDVVFIGPQTHLDDFQDAFHQFINVRSPSAQVLANQISNRIRPTMVVEAGRSYHWGNAMRMRPYVEGRAGDEDLVRIGADVTFGVSGQGELLVRDPASGQRARVIKNEAKGFSLILGADVAHVFESDYLPPNRGLAVVETRERARLGLQYQNQGLGVFYGVTWLGEEFQGQSEGQAIGSIKLDLRW